MVAGDTLTKHSTVGCNGSCSLGKNKHSDYMILKQIFEESLTLIGYEVMWSGRWIYGYFKEPYETHKKKSISTKLS